MLLFCKCDPPLLAYNTVYIWFKIICSFVIKRNFLLNIYCFWNCLWFLPIFDMAANCIRIFIFMKHRDFNECFWIQNWRSTSSWMNDIIFKRKRVFSLLNWKCVITITLMWHLTCWFHLTLICRDNETLTDWSSRDINFNFF